jgi:CRISPR system Cascade subunit CasD
MSTRFLVFQLYGPMASWGDPAVGEVRPSENRPSRSALLGLLAAALGLRREKAAEHQALGEGVRFGMVVDAVGVPLSDYHTIQFGKPKRGRRFTTRREQLGGPSHQLSTLLSERHYRCDAEYRAAVWIADPACPWSLEQLCHALERPCFVLYLGRKSCPLSLPAAPRIVEAPSLAAAFAAYPRRTAEHLPTPTMNPVLAGTSKGLYWEEDESIGGVPVSSLATRRDVPLSRTRWTFGRRHEIRGTLLEGA